MSDPRRPAVTVAIPTYRRPRLLRRAIQSALDQQGVDVLICVFDNCSGDGTAELVQEIARSHPQVRYHCHERNLGAAANFDFAMNSIGTPYFSLLSDDDYLLPDFHRRAVSALEQQPDALFWAGTTLNVDEDGVIWDARLERWPREGRFSPPEGALAMTGGMAPVWTGVVFRRDVIQRFGLPDHETLGPSDLEYLLMLAVHGPYLVEKHPSAVFTLNTNSYSATQPLSGFWPGWQRMIAKVRTMPALAPPDRERLAEALDADARGVLFRRGANAIARGRLDYARDAAQALSGHYGQHSRARLLRLLAWSCARIPGAQALVAGAYRRAEASILASRSAMRARYAGLIRQP
ncbi:glycosyltransferase family 2 protein [Arenimonas terrae]|jgi:hypothetical protein|uniref:Glycosyltransferase family 2 protein n=1 Tax=Arenimonas terrae TaxID=2546226 RepID=A0A5C4RWX6_9GAMM|nr:glycosyltransferase family 2 protein [Arenimonas terrae]TNJ35498.1 glycosyltransferase family 2 protein [Arenimonas terrae]